MESPPSLVPSWPQVIAYAIIAVFSSSITYLTTYLNLRKKLPSDIHKTESEAGLVEAQRDDLQLRTNMSAAEMLKEMSRYTIIIERKLAERDATIRLQELQIEEARARGNLRRIQGD